MVTTQDPTYGIYNLIPGRKKIREHAILFFHLHIKCPQPFFCYVIQAMESCGHAESTLGNRTYFISVGWEIRNFSIPNSDEWRWAESAASLFNQGKLNATALENASLSKLQYITSRG